MMNPFGPRGPSPYGMGGPSSFGGQGQMSLGSLGQGPAANMGWLHTLWGARQPQAPASTLPGAMPDPMQSQPITDQSQQMTQQNALQMANAGPNPFGPGMPALGGTDTPWGGWQGALLPGMNATQSAQAQQAQPGFVMPTAQPSSIWNRNG